MVGGKSGKILIIDDSVNNQNLLMRILQDHGYQTMAADNGKSGLRIALDDRPDLILMDISMPEMDGFQCCQELREGAATREIPVIFISAMDSIEEKVKAFRVGGVDYITKPFNHDEILVRVGTHLKYRKLLQQLERTNRELGVKIEQLHESKVLVQEREGKLRAFVEALPNLAIVFSERGEILEIYPNNGAFAHYFSGNPIGHPIQDVMPSEAAERIMTAIQKVVKRKTIQVVEYELPEIAPETRRFEAHLSSIQGPEAELQKIVLITVDISERVRLFHEVRKLAEQDPLTGCNNRRHFVLLGNHEISQAIRYHHPLSLIMMDIDNFKISNDKFGHPMGDQILRSVVDTCLHILRESDIFARYGGEEFTGLLPETTMEQAVRIAERIRSRIEKLVIKSNGNKTSITLSLGLASLEDLEDNPKTLDGLIFLADRALYTAKANGRNRVRVYDQEN
jgi:two-component system, cell cycle response regulator